MPSELLQIGAICRAHGLRGELRVRLHDPDSSALDSLTRLWTGADSEEGTDRPRDLREWRVRSVRDQQEGYYLLTLEGLSDRNLAESLHQQRLYARRADLPQLSAGEYYVVDLIGCRVVGFDGSPIGLAVDVQEIAGNSLLVVKRTQGGEALVPLVAPILMDVDLKQRVVRIDPPEGLLELQDAPQTSASEVVDQIADGG